MNKTKYTTNTNSLNPNFITGFCDVGNVTVHGDSAMFQVIKLSDLACIIEHFNNYPLKTQKHADYLKKLLML